MPTEPLIGVATPVFLPERYAERRVQVKSNQYLYHMGDPVGDRFYAIQSGYWKCAVVSPCGEQSVLALHVKGHYLGMGELYAQRRASSAISLTGGTLLEFSIEGVLRMAEHDQPLWDHLQALLLQELSRQQRTSQFQRSATAPRKVAAFLLATARIELGPQHCGGHFHLPLSRTDIAGYLGLADTTVSRQLQQLALAGCIVAKGRSVSIIDEPALRRWASQ